MGAGGLGARAEAGRGGGRGGGHELSFGLVEVVLVQDGGVRENVA